MSGGQNFKLSNLPLLPYERQLIKFLEITEEEYREYRDSLINNYRQRPSEYQLIPDIQAGPATPFLVQIAIGLALTAIGILIAPKPQAPKKPEEKEAIALADQTGRSRFNSTGGFNGIQQIAELGSVIPIMFGRYQTHTRNGQTYTTGGFMASPQLVWSRMFSYGSHQGFKGLFVVGEALNDTTVNVAGKDDPTKPEEAGIQIGTLPLDALPNQQKAVYWNTNYPDGRPTGEDLIFGTRGYPAAGDPQTPDDIFNCPLIAGDNLPGFCMSYIPSGDTKFGFSQPISNGNAYMTNFGIVPMPTIENGETDPGLRIKAERRKIAGTNGDDQDEGMGTVGRAYSPQMGCLSLNGQEYGTRTDRVNVKIGDELRFWIRDNCITQRNIDLDIGDKTLKANDVNNAINARRAAADDALQIGELMMIGRTVWQVTNRTNKVWVPQEVNDEGTEPDNDKPGTEVFVTLKMVDSTTIPSMNIIGMPGKKAIEEFVQWEGGEIPADKFIGPSFWHIGKGSLAVIRNVRPADVTEFGLRSNVWNQANGLCNFSNMPPANELVKYEEDGNTLTSGQMSLYYKRSTVFTIFWRPVAEGNQEFDWKPIGEQFVVQGNSPVDQYNWIRVTDVELGPRQMEYRFIPKPSSELRFNVPSGETYLRLDAKLDRVREEPYDTDYGRVLIACCGELITWDNADMRLGIQFNEEYWTSGQKGDSFQVTRPSAAREEERLGNVPYGISSSYAAFILNNLDPDSNQGAKVTRLQTIDVGNRQLTLEWTYQSVNLGTDSDYYRNFDREWYWQPLGIKVVASQGDWDVGDQFSFETNESNYYSDIVNNEFFSDEGDFYYGYRFSISAETTETVNIPQAAARQFGGQTQINAYSMYDEVTCSAMNGPENEIVYVSETSQPAQVPPYAFASLGLALRSSSLLNSIEQVRVWIGDGVRVRRWAEGTEESPEYGPSNLFPDLVYYLLTDKIAGLGTWDSNAIWTKNDTFATAAKFAKANHLFFDGSIDNKVNLRNYLTEMAPLNLCNFVIANGQFAVVPALPFDPNSYEIKPESLPVKAVFSAGNIVDGSFKVEYLDRGERENIKAVMVFRQGQKNKTPQSDAVLVRWNDLDTDQVPQTVFDITNFCSDKEQAKMIGRYMLSIKRRIDHAISFQTSPLGLELAPGDYIRMLTTGSPTDATGFAIGAISAENGQILDVMGLADGTYEITAYLPSDAEVRPMTLEIVNGCAVNQDLWGALFTTLTPRETQNTYLVEQLDLDEEGIVNITASHFPTRLDGTTPKSVIAEDVLDLELDGKPRFFYAD